MQTILTAFYRNVSVNFRWGGLCVNVISTELDTSDTDQSVTSHAENWPAPLPDRLIAAS